MRAYAENARKYALSQSWDTILDNLLAGYKRIIEKICVIGTGYVGLVTAACLAQLQHKVVCVDNAKEKIATLASGGLPLWENGLEQLLQNARAESLISFTMNLSHAIAVSEVLIIAVGTPSQPNGDAFKEKESARLSPTLSSFFYLCLVFHRY
jgi:UDP-N-acetyl-D-mannosaminuronate dehydrogenase